MISHTPGWHLLSRNLGEASHESLLTLRRGLGSGNLINCTRECSAGECSAEACSAEECSAAGKRLGWMRRDKLSRFVGKALQNTRGHYLCRMPKIPAGPGYAREGRLVGVQQWALQELTISRQPPQLAASFVSDQALDAAIGTSRNFSAAQSLIAIGVKRT